MYVSLGFVIWIGERNLGWSDGIRGVCQKHISGPCNCCKESSGHEVAAMLLDGREEMIFTTRLSVSFDDSPLCSRGPLRTATQSILIGSILAEELLLGITRLSATRNNTNRCQLAALQQLCICLVLCLVL